MTWERIYSEEDSVEVRKTFYRAPRMGNSSRRIVTEEEYTNLARAGAEMSLYRTVHDHHVLLRKIGIEASRQRAAQANLAVNRGHYVGRREQGK